jgi:hypothetical protein
MRHFMPQKAVKRPLKYFRPLYRHKGLQKAPLHGRGGRRLMHRRGLRLSIIYVQGKQFAEAANLGTLNPADEVLRR